MDQNVKVENEVSLSTSSNRICTQVKHEYSNIHRYDHQIKLEAPDVNFVITSSGHEVYIKQEPLQNEELQINDESEPSPTEETIEKSAGFENLYCDLCNRKFTKKSNLRQHMKNHTEEKPFKCSLCDYSCIRKAHLLRHFETHTGEKPYKCSICDYSCIRKNDLSKHIKTHTGEKPFKCAVCDYRCLKKSNLSRHMKMHMGEKPV